MKLVSLWQLPQNCGNALALDPDLEAAARVHRDVLVAFVGIAAVTIGATDRLGEMNVIGELQAHPFHDTVTIKAGILAGTGSANQQGDQRNQQSSRFHRVRASNAPF